MNKRLNTAIAVGASLAVMGYLFFSSQIMSLFSIEPETNNRIMIETGVKKEDVVVGTGQMAAPGDRVTVHYVGTLTDGKVFDSSKDRGAPFAFDLGAGDVIRGWDEGVAGMRVGGTRRLIIAPDYGYGDRAIGPIPANSVLIFEVELLGVEKSQ